MPAAPSKRPPKASRSSVGDDWPTAAYLLTPTLLNFVWGILIGEWYLAGRSLPAPISVALIVLGCWIAARQGRPVHSEQTAL